MSNPRGLWTNFVKNITDVYTKTVGFTDDIMITHKPHLRNPHKPHILLTLWQRYKLYYRRFNEKNNKISKYNSLPVFHSGKKTRTSPCTLALPRGFTQSSIPYFFVHMMSPNWRWKFVCVHFSPHFCSKAKRKRQEISGAEWSLVISRMPKFAVGFNSWVITIPPTFPRWRILDRARFAKIK